MGLTRRELLGGACAAGAAALAGGCTGAGTANAGVARTSAQRPEAASGAGAAADGGSFTFVHLTDMHVTPRRQGNEGYRACIASINALRPRPAFVLMGGDLAFDGNYNEKADFAEQIRLYKEISDTLEMPYYNCLGNHDGLGWGPRRKVPVSDPDLGKKMIMKALGWEKPYYSFDYGGWHFVVLDSMFEIDTPSGPTYEPRIGREQLEWLAYDLGAAAGRPCVAVTHIAAFCNRGQLSGNPDYKAMDGHMVLWDTRELRAVLERHGVKALLQGHSHDIEEYRYNGVWYLTSAAASGAWWAGSWVGSEPGYTVFTCAGDQLSWEHKTFGWEPRLDPGDDLERRRIAEQQAAAAEQERLLERERAGRR